MAGWSKRRAGAAALGLGLGGALLAFSYGRWRCPILALTGVPCASCGMTTAFLRLLHMDPAGAWAANPLIFLLIPWCLWAALLYVRGGPEALRDKRLWAAFLAALAAAGGWRLVRSFV